MQRLLLRAGLRYQARHRWQALLALAGVALGVAVVLAVDLAAGAARASFALSAEQLRGAATHRIVGTTGTLPQGLYRDLFTSPGHPPMAPVLTLGVGIEGHPQRARLVGLDLFAEAGFRGELGGVVRGEGALGDWLAAPDAVVVGAATAQALGVAPGDMLTIRYQGHSHRLSVFAVYADQGPGTGDLLLVDIATAQAIAGGSDTLSHIDLVLDQAAQHWVEARLPPDARLVTVDAQIAGIARMSAAFELNLTAMGLLALLVGVFLIFNAISLTVVQRRNLFGRLRALGVLPRELARLVLSEALVFGVVGSLLGVALGIWLGRGLTGVVAATVSELYYEASNAATTITAIGLLKAMALGVGGTLAATWIPARAAAGTPPLTTLSRAALERATRARIPRLAMGGLLTAVLGLGIAFRAPGGVVTGFVGLFLLLLGSALLVPMVLRLAQHLLAPFARSGVPRMAVRALDRHLSRLGTASAALTVALAASVGVAVMVGSMRSAVDDWLGDLLAADLYIAPAGFDEGATLPPEVVEAASALTHTTAVSRYRNLHLTHTTPPIRLVAAALATPSRAGFQLLESAAPDPWRLFDAGAVLISEPLAHRLGLGAGDLLQLPTPAGGRAFEVAAVFRDYASEHGRVFVAMDRYREIWGDPAVNSLSLFADAAGRATLLGEAQARLGARDDLVFTSAGEIHRESMAVFDRTFRITEVLRYLSLLVAFVGILSALMALQLERRKEYAVLRALGMTPHQIAQMIAMESGLLGLFAALLAIPTGIALAWVLTDAIQVRAFGWSMALQLPFAPLSLTLVLGPTAALLAGLYPAWQAARHAPGPQLREE